FLNMTPDEVKSFIEVDCDKFSSGKPFSFYISKNFVEYSERDRVTAEIIQNICHLRATNMNLNNKSFKNKRQELQPKDYGLIFTNKVRIHIQILIMIRTLVSYNIYLVDEIDFTGTVNFDPSGAIVFNLIQCEYVEDPNNETVDRHCYFLLRSLYTLYEDNLSEDFFHLASHVRECLINGTDLYRSLSAPDKPAQSIFLFGLNVGNFFYLFTDYYVPYSIARLDQSEHKVNSGRHQFRVRCFKKNSHFLAVFMSTCKFAKMKTYEDWEFVYVIYS
ncbi:hypothetical protein MHBO_003760, partial [Bonamia ostreae]